MFARAYIPCVCCRTDLRLTCGYLALMKSPNMRRLWQALGSLKVRFAIQGAAIIAVSVAATALLVLRDVERRTELAMLDAEHGHTERLARVVSARLVALQLALRTGSLDFPVDKLDDAQAMKSFVASRRILKSLFENVSVFDANGRMLALSDAQGTRSPNVSVSDRPYFLKTRAEGRPVISEPIVSRVSGEPIIILSMPIGGPNGGMVAMLTGTLKLSGQAIVGDLTQSGSSDHDPVTTIVVDPSGRIISHPEAAWIMRDVQSEPRLAQAVTSWIAQGRPVEPQGSAMRAGDYVVGMAGVPDADWMIFRTAPAEVLLGGPTAGRRHALWLAAGVAVAGGLVILLMSALMLHPLRQLELRAQRLQHDELAAEHDWPQVRGEIGRLSKVFQHVIRQKAQSQTARDELLARMQAVMGNAPVGITFSRDRKFDLVSEHFGHLFGYDSRALVGQSARLLYPSQAAYTAIGERLSAATAAGKVFNEEVEFQRRDGSRFWGHFQATPVNMADPSAGSITIISDITESREHRQRLSWAASHDSLTDLVSRREFEAQLSEELTRRANGASACALFIDLDDFKLVNDSAGHAAGDAMLKNVAAILRERVRDADTVARLGGDEFAVLLRGCDAEAAILVADQMRASIEAHRLLWKGRVLRVGASIGVVSIDASLADAAAVIAAADAACYGAKRAGRNAVSVHEGHPSPLENAPE